jgi:hypothetical protein
MRSPSRIGVAAAILSVATIAFVKAATPSIAVRFDPDKPNEKVAPIWLGYLMARIAFHDKHHLPLPASGEIIPTLEEEIDARHAASQMYRELKEKDAKLQDAYWDTLSEVDRRGFMAAYVWTYLRRKQWPAASRPANLLAFEEWRQRALPKHTPQTYGSLEAGKP